MLPATDDGDTNDIMMCTLLVVTVTIVAVVLPFTTMLGAPNMSNEKRERRRTILGGRYERESDCGQQMLLLEQ